MLKGQCGSGPICTHPENPHYFLFNGEPTILVTSAEHYGAVVNKDFDTIAYLDALRSYGLNYTRIYPGALFEPRDKFLPGNTLGPRPEALLLPWARSEQPGYKLGGNKFDLSRWDADYFQRYRSFIGEAGQRGIVVEICMFNCQYEDTWGISPLGGGNNIQGVGGCPFDDAQTLRHPDLVAAQEAYVRKLTEEANEFDNVILEICDEPILLGTPAAEAGAWISRMIDVVLAAEKGLPKRHLIGQQVQGTFGGPCDFSGDRRVGLIIAQYTWEAMSAQLGGMHALDTLYAQSKPIEINETNYYPIWYSGDTVAASRVEAWEFIVGGGAGFNQLNGLYTVANPTGDTPDNAAICAALRHLLAFMHRFDFVHMRPDRNAVVGGVPQGALCRCLSEPGRQYAVYVHHSKNERGASYHVQVGTYQIDLVLYLPPGRYRAEWVEPASGSVLAEERFTHEGGTYTVTSPGYRLDIALRVKSSARQV